MWITRHIAARSLVWLAAVTVPMQGLPAASCGCTSGKICCQQDGQSTDCCCSRSPDASGPTSRKCCCCQQGTTGACACTGAKICRCNADSPCRKSPEKTCCCQSSSAGDSVCKCGPNCQCRQTKPPQPATPPVQTNNSTVKALSQSSSPAGVATIYEAQVPQRHNDVPLEADALTALDHCVLLSRFTL
jgi:hypothetical protein